ncbi:hypothetical protein FBU59_004818 [Linderina macrospora]|uniref:Uncharacterized protein n=1 Tax=Linderina macrospora TaxID=4868 RepID=A0ACC1J4L0_9FUNG|nr:hypothetical protein FBU59_004818 [Linderina macrospora]
MASAMGVETFSNLQNLVRQYGENWDVIGREMHALPSMLKHAWKGYSVDTKITAQWTADELATLRHCEKSNIPPAKAARIIGTKLPAQCMNIRKSLRHSDFNDAERASNKKLKWTAEQDQELDRLAKIHIRKGGVDWAVVARDTGRTVRSCLARHARIKHDADLQQQGELAIRVSSEVKRQRESGTEVDWALVAELVGATELECLECSTYDEGKQRWSYDHRTFSWDLPNRMRDFIDKYYPNPLIPSFAASRFQTK